VHGSGDTQKNALCVERERENNMPSCVTKGSDRASQIYTEKGKE
jgi:hypothetical protein